MDAVFANATIGNSSAVYLSDERATHARREDRKQGDFRSGTRGRHHHHHQSDHQEPGSDKLRVDPKFVSLMKSRNRALKRTKFQVCDASLFQIQLRVAFLFSRRLQFQNWCTHGGIWSLGELIMPVSSEHRDKTFFAAKSESMSLETILLVPFVRHAFFVS